MDKASRKANKNLSQKGDKFKTKISVTVCVTAIVTRAFNSGNSGPYPDWCKCRLWNVILYLYTAIFTTPFNLSTCRWRANQTSEPSWSTRLWGHLLLQRGAVVELFPARNLLRLPNLEQAPKPKLIYIPRVNLMCPSLKVYQKHPKTEKIRTT